MISVAGIDHIVLRCADLERMRAFYCDVLGLAVAKHNAALAMYHLRAGESLIDLIAVDGPLGRTGGGAAGAGNRNVDHICLAVRDFDLDAVKAHLLSHGVTPGAEGTRFGAGGDGLSLTLTDPEGNGLELRAA